MNDFGVFDSANPSQVTPNSFVQRWYLEYSVIAENSQTQMQTVYENYDGLQRGQAEAQSALNDGISSLNEIKDSFDKVKKKISSVIVKYSDKIDEYGNIGYKAIFSIFLVIDALIAAFISLRMFCKFPTCQSGCLNCLLKSGIHILWNILAFTTFLTLILGSLLTLVGTAGNDLISVVSFLVSDENLGKSNENDIILLGSAAKYLKKCINGNGDLRHELNLDNGAAKNLDDLKEASNKIEELEEETQALQQKIEYTKYLENYNKRKMYQTDDFSLVNIDDSSKKLNLGEYLNKLNSEHYNEEWRISCSNNEHSCDSVDTSHSSPHCIKLSSCSSKKVSNWYTSSTDNIKVVDAFIESINTAKSIVSSPTTSTNTKSIENVLKILDDQYSSFLRTQSSSLVSIKDAISTFTSIFNDLAGEGGAFDAINCLFIGNNIRIILNSLEKSLGENIRTVGITLTTTGLGMCLSISFTILLNIILNTKDSGNGTTTVKDVDPNVNIINQYDYMNQQNANLNNGNAFNSNGNFNEGLRIIDYNNGM